VALFALNAGNASVRDVHHSSYVEVLSGSIWIFWARTESFG